MQSLESVFEQRRDSPLNEAMLANLAIIATAHEERPMPLGEELGVKPLHYQWMSAYAVEDKTIIDRRPSLLAAHHEVTPGQLQDFAAGGTVLDVGPGQSRLLDAFRDRSRTVAADAHEQHVGFQVDRGHDGIVAKAHELPLNEGGVRLLHAAYSAPFWSATTEEAVGAADEYIRVLEPGGIALVGPFGRKDEHEHYEYVAMEKRYDGRPVLPWADYEDAPLSRIRTAFCRSLLDRQQKGEVELVGSRYVADDKTDFRRGARHLHVPNFLMMRRVI